MSQLTALGSKPGLERIERLLKEMGNPEKELKCVHIAGTNGKGSTSLIIASVLTKAGYKVGRFISPHVHSYRERFTIDGVEIDPWTLKRYIDEVEEKIAVMVEEGFPHPTEFEVLTAIAFQYFKDAEVDIAVIEVGMGGLYDSTNVITPLVSVITSVGLDHTDFLGTTIAEVAYNKAGIIKTGVPVVVGDLPEEAWQVVIKEAGAKGAPIYASSMTWVKREDLPQIGEQKVSIEFAGYELNSVSFALLGDYQLDNLATAYTALMVLKQLGYKITDDNVRDALASLHIPGRLEIVSRDPLVIVDVAHNPHGASALNRSLASLLPGRQKVLVCGMVDDKDATETLNFLGQDTRVCVLTRPEGPRGNNWRRAAAIFADLYPEIEVYQIEDIAQAVKKGLEMLRKDEYLLITGSFYVINQARRVFVKD
ncbi:folylpolyglutamate synthase/dihydrofolate synthase family protein [Thermosyntropha sp.]|uniref:bifunctional folylpolyglutamate synthase/dihydrofolate synthase n=1 Tax=Thermosyntropha sp. TaxID=2740820 RepID=UPI0025E47F5E|nr:folylpolyglutamate synthase/dihydrofolate synthase family protein [Thermosyntropha sp.]MBO8158795.1 bifunctional folylpolyglutamate synthase/dihydrofolate synthase [Thermosyntropha sp.]